MNLQSQDQCICGNTTIKASEAASEQATYTYCCNSESSPCRQEGEKIFCEKGIVKNITEKCFNDCPFSRCKSLFT